MPHNKTVSITLKPHLSDTIIVPNKRIGNIKITVIKILLFIIVYGFTGKLFNIENFFPSNEIIDDVIDDINVLILIHAAIINGKYNFT